MERGTVPGADVFQNEDSALASLKARGLAKTVTRSRALLGYAVFGETALALVARRVRVAAVLPNGHEVLTVVEAKWHRAPLRDPKACLTKEERNRVASLTETPMENLYFYCETYDATRPFALAGDEDDDDDDDEKNQTRRSSGPNENGDPQWVWNAWLSEPLRALDIPNACPALLQGLAESRRLTDLKGREYRVAVFGRRSSAHPGTRYNARGLNDAAAPGNEVEMEQIVWTRERVGSEEGSEATTRHATTVEEPPSVSSTGGRDAQPRRARDDASLSECSVWSSYVWRRGSVPIRWRQEIKQSIGDAEIFVSDENPYRGTGQYFASLARGYRPGDATREDGFPVTCVNLLRCAPGKPELLLSEHFHEAVRGVRRRAGLSGITVLNFDWHGNIKALGEAKTVEGLWNALRSHLADAGVARGRCRTRGGAGGEPETKAEAKKNEKGENVLAEDDARDARSRDAGSPSVEGSAPAIGTSFAAAPSRKVTSTYQRGVLRYNCADSLDRTNLASYFAAVQVLAEQARLLGLDVARDIDAASVDAERDASAAAATYGRRDGASASGPAPPQVLPHGWESRYDTVTGRTFYIDHNTRTTQWSLPTPPPEATAGTARGLADRAPPAEPPADGDEKKTDVPESRSSGERGTSAGAEDGRQAAWRLLSLGVDDVRRAVHPGALAAMCEIFLANGDLHSAVYTASRAIHTSIFHLLDGSSTAPTKTGPSQGGAYAAASSLSNLSISAQRRFLNLTQDAHRQQQFEMFLGARREAHFPSLTRGGGSRRGHGEVGETEKTASGGSASGSANAVASMRLSGTESPTPTLASPGGSGSFSGSLSGSFSRGFPGMAAAAARVTGTPPLSRTTSTPGKPDAPVAGGVSVRDAAAAAAAAAARRGEDARGGEAREKNAGASGGTPGGTPPPPPQQKVLSRPPSAVVLSAPRSMGAPLAPPEALLGAATASAATPLWVCPAPEDEDKDADANGNALVVWLGVPGSVDRVALTSPRGAPECVTPTRLDVFAGSSLDTLRPIARDIALPRSPPGTTMSFAMGARAPRDAGIAGAWRFDDVDDDDDAESLGGFFRRASLDERSRSRVAHHGSCSGSAGSGEHRVVRVVFRAETGGNRAAYPGGRRNERRPTVAALPHVEILGVPAEAASRSSSGAREPLSRAASGSAPESLARADTPLGDDFDVMTANATASDATAETDVIGLEGSWNAESLSARVAEYESAARGVFVFDSAESKTAESKTENAPSLAARLALEQTRLRLGLGASKRDEVLRRLGVSRDAADPTPLLLARRVRALAEALASERAAAAAAAAAAPAPRALSAIASLSPWEQLIGQGATVARAVGGVVAGASGGSLTAMVDRVSATGPQATSATTSGSGAGADARRETLDVMSLKKEKAASDAGVPIAPPPFGSGLLGSVSDSPGPSAMVESPGTPGAPSDAPGSPGDPAACAAGTELSPDASEDALAELDRLAARFARARKENTRARETRVSETRPPRIRHPIALEKLSARTRRIRRDGSATDRSTDDIDVSHSSRSFADADEAVFSFSFSRRSAHASGGLVRASSCAATFAFPARARTSRLALRAGPAAEIPVGTQFTLRVADDDAFANETDAKKKDDATVRWTVAGAPVAADEVFVLDCGDARIASCRIARLETSAPDGTDAETLGLDFSVAKVAAKPSFPPPTTKETTKETTRSIRDPDEPDERTTDDVRFASFFGPTRLSVLDPTVARPELARALDEAAASAPAITRARSAFESAHRGGTIVHVGPPRDEGVGGTNGAPFVSGFRVTPPDDWIQSRDWIIRVTASFAEHDGITHAAEALASSRRRIATVAAEGEPDARHSGFLGFLRDRGGDGGGSHPSHPSHPSVSLATRDGPPVPEAARDFLAADVSRDADAVGPRGAHDIAAETEIYAKPKSPNKTTGKKRHASAFRVGDFLVPRTRGGAPLRFEFSEDVAGFERLVFESLLSESASGGYASGGDGETETREETREDEPPAPSLVGRVRCYRLG